MAQSVSPFAAGPAFRAVLFKLNSTFALFLLFTFDRELRRVYSMHVSTQRFTLFKVTVQPITMSPTAQRYQTP